MAVPPIVSFRIILHPLGRYNGYDRGIVNQSDKLHEPEAYEMHHRVGDILRLLDALSLERVCDLDNGSAHPRPNGANPPTVVPLGCYAEHSERETQHLGSPRNARETCLSPGAGGGPN